MARKSAVPEIKKADKAPEEEALRAATQEATKSVTPTPSLSRLARNKERLDRQPKVGVKAHQNPPGEMQKHDIQVRHNGVLCVIPRDNQWHAIPRSIAQIIDQSDYHDIQLKGDY